MDQLLLPGQECRDTFRRRNRCCGRDAGFPGPAAARRLFDSWKSAIPPRRIIGNIHYAGLSGVSSFLITTPDGHIRVDTCFEDSIPRIPSLIPKAGAD